MKILMSILLPVLLGGVEEKATYLLASGRAMVAEVLDVDGSRVRMRVHVGGGALEKWFALEEFRPQSAYRILRSVADPAEPGAHLNLAEFAARKGLIAAAKRELEVARRLSGNTALGSGIAKTISRRAAEGLEGLFRDALSKGRLDSAQRYLSLIMIRYPGAMSDAEKGALATLLDSERDAAKDARRRARAERENTKATKQREQRMRVPRKHLTSGSAANRKGLLESRHFATAHGHFTRAVRHYEAAIKSVTSLGRRYQGDDLLKREARAVQTEAEAGMKASLLNSGSLCLVRGKFSAAMEHVNRVLAMESRNSRALSMRARIEIAANQWGYGY